MMEDREKKAKGDEEPPRESPEETTDRRLERRTSTTSPVAVSTKEEARSESDWIPSCRGRTISPPTGLLGTKTGRKRRRKEDDVFLPLANPKPPAQQLA
ncbi:unnamed protein product [Linum trigynum]|uniref:Uncharacterized protein n=1 Tax=Linum trigynum TaxID=586398 RepID=A0AAV2GBZ1_9ROSI